MDWITLVTVLLAPVTGVVTWLFSKPKRKSDAVEGMQKTIDMLFEKNQKLYSKIVDLQEHKVKIMEELAEVRYTLKGLGVMAAQPAKKSAKKPVSE